jgi:hypothetical protein
VPSAIDSRPRGCETGPIFACGESGRNTFQPGISRMKPSELNVVEAYLIVMSFKRIGAMGLEVRFVGTKGPEGADMAVPFGPISVTVAR